MRLFLRCPLTSIAVLTVYLGVNIGGGALHHHPGAAIRRGEGTTAGDLGLQFQTRSPAEDEDEGATCLLCSVLHLAQTLPSAFHLEAGAAYSGKLFSAAAIIRSYPLETATHSRAPPPL